MRVPPDSFPTAQSLEPVTSQESKHDRGAWRRLARLSLPPTGAACQVGEILTALDRLPDVAIPGTAAPPAGRRSDALGGSSLRLRPASDWRRLVRLSRSAVSASRRTGLRTAPPR